MQAARNATCCRHPGERIQAEGPAAVDNEVALFSRTATSTFLTGPVTGVQSALTRQSMH